MGENMKLEQAPKSGSGKFGDALHSIGRFFKRNWRWAFELRKIIMAIPVVVLMLTLLLNVFGESLLEMLPPARGALWQLLSELIDLRFLLLIVLQSVSVMDLLLRIRS